MNTCRFCGASLILTTHSPDGKDYRSYRCGTWGNGAQTPACELLLAIRNHRDAKWGEGEPVDDEQDALLYAVADKLL